MNELKAVMIYVKIAVTQSISKTETFNPFSLNPDKMLFILS